MAFDVLQKVNPSYGLRMAGLGAGASLLGAFWIAATAMLLFQDIGRGGKWMWRDTPGVSVRRTLGQNVLRDGIRDYLRRDFNPRDNDNFHLAAAYLASIGLGQDA